MASQADSESDIQRFALRAGPPHAVVQRAEALLLARRAGAPDVPGAVAQALADAVGDQQPPDAVIRSAQAIARMVERHGAAFPPGAEPPYHDRHHQAEAVLAMGWLAGLARRQGLIDAGQAALGVAAMAGHDLLHDGRVHAERGLLERRSAEAAARIARAEGLAEGDVATLVRIIMATTWPWEDEDAGDLITQLAREADLFGSSLPVLGPVLSQLLARELAMAGQPAAGAVPTHAARVALLRRMPPASAPARLLGLDAARDAQLQALAGVARRLRLAEPTAEAAAAALDCMPPGEAAAQLAGS